MVPGDVAGELAVDLDGVGREGGRWTSDRLRLAGVEEGGDGDDGERARQRVHVVLGLVSGDTRPAEDPVVVLGEVVRVAVLDGLIVGVEAHHRVVTDLEVAGCDWDLARGDRLQCHGRWRGRQDDPRLERFQGRTAGLQSTGHRRSPRFGEAVSCRTGSRREPALKCLSRSLRLRTKSWSFRQISYVCMY